MKPKGEPNSSEELYNPDGTVKQKRWYGPDGNAERDRDYNHNGDMPFPHDHEWKDGKRSKEHLPPSPEYKISIDNVVGVGVVIISMLGAAVLIADDSTGIGAMDDAFIPAMIKLGEIGIGMMA